MFSYKKTSQLDLNAKRGRDEEACKLELMIVCWVQKALVKKIMLHIKKSIYSCVVKYNRFAIYQNFVAILE
ncbi:hypothetical protein BpHYR1_028930 [Brachionus plicatilis]|uniref:Uncharacterized protein n=1 Tax=Brachionus plicatilis TaxID=10195 RepID=A0A3M7RRS8_BRAPC|nr:hypothetical protein BpHYR1_028930 [Brachionus plicatilis]